MITGTQSKLELTLEIPKDNVWELIRERDGLVKKSHAVKWMEWDKNNMAKKLHVNPKKGYSLVMSPFSSSYTWMTTGVIKIIEKTKNKIIFTTKNSNYILKKLLLILFIITISCTRSKIKEEEIQETSRIADLTLLNDLVGNWTVGNQCGVPNFINGHVYADLILKDTCYLMNSKLTVHGIIIYNNYPIILLCGNSELIELQ